MSDSSPSSRENSDALLHDVGRALANAVLDAGLKGRKLRSFSFLRPRDWTQIETSSRSRLDQFKAYESLRTTQPPWQGASVDFSPSKCRRNSDGQVVIPAPSFPQFVSVASIVNNPGPAREWMKREHLDNLSEVRVPLLRGFIGELSRHLDPIYVNEIRVQIIQSLLDNARNAPGLKGIADREDILRVMAAVADHSINPLSSEPLRSRPSTSDQRPLTPYQFATPPANPTPPQDPDPRAAQARRRVTPPPAQNPMEQMTRWLESRIEAVRICDERIVELGVVKVHLPLHRTRINEQINRKDKPKVAKEHETAAGKIINALIAYKGVLELASSRESPTLAEAATTASDAMRTALRRVRVPGGYWNKDLSELHKSAVAPSLPGTDFMRPVEMATKALIYFTRLDQRLGPEMNTGRDGPDHWQVP